MGRVLKRVPLDFNWPLNVVWKGYLNPYQPIDCKVCGGIGYNADTRRLSKQWSGIDGWRYHLTQDEVNALLKEDRLWGFTRVPITDEQREIVEKKLADGGNSWLPFDNGYTPTAEEVNKWARVGFGHDAINRCICVEARAERLGVYGLCSSCGGDGYYWIDDDYRLLSESWEPTDPPTGVGYQLWETTSEGSPSSPIFSTLDKLGEWCETNATTFSEFTATKGEWIKMLGDGLVSHQEGLCIFI